MKKSLVALAALAAVSAVSAQSSVTLYGNVDIGYAASKNQSRDGQTVLRSRGLSEGTNAGNRIGFRGTEDLGGGLKANFVVEESISPTSNNVYQRSGGSNQNIPLAQLPVGAKSSFGTVAAPTNTNRQTYVGLSSADLGTFNIGYQYTIGYEISTLSGYNIGSEGMPGADRAHLAGTTAVGGTRANGLTYISPDIAGGFTVRAQYGSATELRDSVTYNSATPGASSDQRSNRYGLMGQYKNGPLSAALGYTRLRNTGFAAGLTAGLPNAPTTGTAHLTQLGSSYDFGVVKLAGTYNDGRDVAGAKIRAYQVGLSAPFGAIVPFVTVGRSRSTVAGGGARTEDAKQAQIGVRYSLSKRTTAYAMYGQVKDDGTAVNGTLAANATLGSRDRRSVVGVMHSF